MSSIRVSGNTSGYYDLTVPDVAGQNTIPLDQVVTTDTGGNLYVSGIVQSTRTNYAKVVLNSTAQTSDTYLLENTNGKFAITENHGGSTVGSHFYVVPGGNVGIGTDSPSGGLTLYGNGYGDKGKLFVYGGGDENSWSQTRNEVMRIGRGDIKDSYYNSIWSATGSGGENNHWLRFYINQGQTSGTAQILATEMNGNGHVLTPNQPMCSVSYTGGPKNSAGAILFNQVLVNNGNNYNATNGRFTCPVAGFYKMDTSLLSNSGDIIGASLCKNGNAIYKIENTNPGSNYRQISGTGIFQCAYGDFLTIEWKNGTIYGGGGNYTSMNVMLVG